MRDEGLRARSAAEAARLSEETFVWENEARKYVAVYERALAAATASSAKRMDADAI